jgi:hypothetical protein
MRYLVRCLVCDRAFWLEAREAPVPLHSRWNRRLQRAQADGDRCGGSACPGFWIGEGDGPLAGWPDYPGERVVRKEAE